MNQTWVAYLDTRSVERESDGVRFTLRCRIVQMGISFHGFRWSFYDAILTTSGGVHEIGKICRAAPP